MEEIRILFKTKYIKIFIFDKKIVEKGNSSSFRCGLQKLHYNNKMITLRCRTKQDSFAGYCNFL